MVVRSTGTQADITVTPNGMIGVWVLDSGSIYFYFYDQEFNLIETGTTNISSPDDVQFSVIATTIDNETVFIITYLSSGAVLTRTSRDGKTFA